MEQHWQGSSNQHTPLAAWLVVVMAVVVVVVGLWRGRVWVQGRKRREGRGEKEERKRKESKARERKGMAWTAAAVGILYRSKLSMFALGSTSCR